MLNKVSLNTIGLNRIGLNRIGKPSRASSDRPYIDPEVLASLKAVCICYGKSNDDPDRAIVKNLVDPDNPFVISNAAFKLNSGFGKYETELSNTRIWTQSKETTSSPFSSSYNGLSGWTLFANTPLTNSADMPSFKIQVKGLLEGQELIYRYYDSNGQSNVYSMGKDGEYILPSDVRTAKPQTSNTSGFQVVKNDTNTITITQIPSFEGAFVTDGIDDLITSTKTVQEMLGGSTEFTAVSMIHLISPGQDVGGVAYTNYIRISDNYWTTNRVSNTDKTGIYGYSFKQGTPTVINNILGDKNDYTTEKSNIVSDGSVSDLFRANFSVEGFEHVINGAVHASSVAWYWTIIANKVLTTDQINQVIAYFNLDRTLKPDILCNTIKQGITNENHAEFGDRLIDFSGNGRDIQLNNIAWKGDSGIGKYNFSNISIIANRFEGTVTTNKCHFTKKLTNTTNNFCDLVAISPNEPIKFKVSGLSDGRKLFVANKSGSGSNYNFDNGEHEVSLSFAEGVGQNNPFGVTGDIGDIDVTVEFIPSHAGALCLDGVNDFGKVTGMPIYKDYTFIADRYINNNVGSVASKSIDSNQYGAFIFEIGRSNYSFNVNSTGATNFNKDRTISYLSKYSYNGENVNVGNEKDSDLLWIGTIRDNETRFSSISIYSLMSFPYSMSEFLIERQLKKHKLGTLYPDMVEFRPVIKTNTEWEYLEIYQGDNRLYNLSEHDDKTGIYLEENSSIEIYVKPYTGQKVSKIVYNGTSYIDLENNDYGYYYITVPVTKSPQKIGITIEWDENYVQWNPVVESNVAYKSIRYYKLGDSGSGWIGINIGDYIPIGRMIMITIDTANTVDELVSAVSSQLTGIGINGSNGTYNITGTLTSESPQNINITIDEYIRFEDIVQPYPLFFEFTDENGNLISWGGKAKVGNTIIRTKSVSNANILAGLYNSSSYKLNGKPLEGNSYVVEKQMVFTCTTTYLLDNNEPKCILSPSRLRIPNSSYKLLGYIPDISGHGNHGKINNSAYAEGSGVNEDGSYQFDGVDDFVTIPTLSSGGKQVLMKVNSRKSDCYLYDQRNNWTQYLGIVSTKDFIAYNYSNQRGKTYIDGILNENITANDLIGITHNITVTNNRNDVKQYSPCIGTSFARNSYAQMALYDFMLFDDISTDNKIKELNEYVGIEAKVELPPYYWDTYGKTNSDADKATIQQRGVAIGDYDLTNSNFAYDKMSGFGGYAFAKFDNTEEWQLSSASDTMELLSTNGYSFTARRLEGQTWWKYKNKVTTDVGKNLTVKVRTNNSVRINWELKYRTAEMPDADSTLGLISTLLTPNVVNDIILPVKTQEELDSLGAISHFYIIYFPPIDVRIGDEYTVEMLPLYTNGLVYDGITDYSKNANIPALDDFTAIIKREWLKKQGCPLIKGSKVYEGGNGNALLLEWDKAYNFVFYKRTDIMEGELPDNISFITPTNYNGNVITRGSEQDTNGICIAGDGNAGFANMVFYKLILYPKTIPLLQINFLKNLMEKDEIIDLNNPIFIK